MTASVPGVMSLLKESSTASWRTGGHRRLGSQGGQRPGNGVVLIARDDHTPSRRHQAFDGDVQCVCGIQCEHHLLRIVQMKKLRQLTAAGKRRVRRSHGGAISAAAR